MWFLDEVFVTINGQRQYLWRAVDQDGNVIDIPMLATSIGGTVTGKGGESYCRG